MTKSISQIRRNKLDHFFVGTQSKQIATDEKWYEIGHFIKGVDFACDRIIETDDDLNDWGGIGYQFTLTGEPAQNTIGNYADYFSIMNGKRNIAMLTGDLLRIFRLHNIGGGKWEDNRVSMITNDKYNSSMDKAYMKCSGYIQNYEMYRVKNVSVNAGKLQFTILETLGSTGILVSNGNTGG